MGFLNNRTVNNIMTWDEISKVLSELQKCNQNTQKNQVLDLVNKILIEKKCKKVYFQSGFFIKELSVPVESHGLELAAMISGNSLTHECLPLWFRDGYAFEPCFEVKQFLKERNCK